MKTRSFHLRCPIYSSFKREFLTTAPRVIVSEWCYFACILACWLLSFYSFLVLPDRNLTILKDSLKVYDAVTIKNMEKNCILGFYFAVVLYCVLFALQILYTVKKCEIF